MFQFRTALFAAVVATTTAFVGCGGSKTVEDEYEQALHVYLMEQQAFEEADASMKTDRKRAASLLTSEELRDEKKADAKMKELTAEWQGIHDRQAQRVNEAVERLKNVEKRRPKIAAEKAR